MSFSVAGIIVRVLCFFELFRFAEFDIVQPIDHSNNFSVASSDLITAEGKNGSIRQNSSVSANKTAHKFPGNEEATDNCPGRGSSIDEFPTDLFTEEERLHGAILFHLLIGFYCFVLIAFVCNDYFLPSVFCICQDLRLSHDIAGATFMATATCAPELFVNVIGTFLTQSDLGVGTVVGSAVCNIFAVAGCAGLAASKSIKLEVWPLVRDSVVYMLAVGLLALILMDNVITWYEALSLLLLYFVYFLLMFTQKKIKTAVKKTLESKNSLNSISSREAIFPFSSEYCYGTYRPFYFTSFSLPTAEKATMANANNNNNTSRNEHLPSNTDKNVHNPISNGTKEKQDLEKNEFEEEVTPLCKPPGGTWLKLWWFMSLPISSALSISIPDCRVTRKYYPLTFIMCIVWIGVSSYFVSWMMTVFGDTFGINDAVMGMTFLAIGGSIPEAASAIANARAGIGSMSISNALGANTLDILLCLSAPWLIKTLMPASMNGGPIRMETSGLAFNCLCLIASIIILNSVTFATSFQMNRLYGVICLLIYLSFITLFVLSDMNILFNFNSNNSC